MTTRTDVTPNLCMDQARYAANKEAVYDYDAGKRYSFAELHERAERVAAFLTEELHLKKGDRVAFLSENAMPFLDVFFSGYKTGVIMTSFNCMLGAEEILRTVELEDPSVIFFSNAQRALAERLRADARRERIHIALAEGPGRHDHIYDDVVNYAPKGNAVYDPPAPEDVQMLIHTGGTTGEPKSAMMSYRAIYYNATSEILSWHLGYGDSALVVLPFFHTAGWNVLMLPMLLAGGRVILTASFDPEKTLKIFREERPTTNIGVETIYK
ncbi:MAG: acyl--CoA ligase, partial [Clostridiales Family XIII bacterium]|nr:acyl--CoA ligase [Clostridiales Family XIII bacterium]